MDNQGLLGAVEQYWTVEEKPRLHRKNTYFEDHPRVSDFGALKLYLLVLTALITIVMLCVVGVMV